MRRLILLALIALAAFPLSAHGRWRRFPRRVVVVENDTCRDSYRRWEDERWERRGYYPEAYVRPYRGEDCDEDRVVLRPVPRPLPPPFQARVELWFR